VLDGVVLALLEKSRAEDVSFWIGGKTALKKGIAGGCTEEDHRLSIAHVNGLLEKIGGSHNQGYYVSKKRRDAIGGAHILFVTTMKTPYFLTFQVYFGNKHRRIELKDLVKVIKLKSASGDYYAWSLLSDRDITVVARGHCLQRMCERGGLRFEEAIKTLAQVEAWKDIGGGVFKLKGYQQCLRGCKENNLIIFDTFY
jgi:hypothetical protein